MIILIAFAFLAGIVTILSPCILPILPIILSSTVGDTKIGRARPLGVVAGFIASFTFFTLFLSTIVKVSGISSELLRNLSVVVIAGFGLSLILPQFQKLMESLFSRLSRFVPKGGTKTGFGGGVLIGLSLGLLWTPCVGPILASVISLAITGSVSADAFVITLAYSLGTALPMFAIMIGGQSVLRKVPWLVRNTATIQKTFGVFMIITAFAIYANLDRTFQTYILNTFPQYGTGLTNFENVDTVKDQLKKLGGEDPTDKQGKAMFDLTDPGTPAPEIVPGGRWHNSTAQTLKELRGKVVIIDFWTYSCINCQRTFPYLKKWHQTYGDKGLVIIGVHAPEFEFEKSEKNVAKAIKDFGIEYPVVQDNDFATWKAYNNRYWPAKYIIDKDGNVRYTHFGEGEYDETERVIQDLLKEAGTKNLPTTINNEEYKNYSRTHETYLGYERIDYLASPEKIQFDKPATYTAPQTLPDNTMAFAGTWTIMPESANPALGSTLTYNFEAKEVYLVMRPKDGKAARVAVYVDGQKQYLGTDVVDGIVTVDHDTLYKLVKLAASGRHTITLEFLDGNAELYAFTFG